MHFTIQFFRFGYELCISSYRPDIDVLLVIKPTLCKFLLTKLCKPSTVWLTLSFKTFNVLCVVLVKNTV